MGLLSATFMRMDCVVVLATLGLSRGTTEVDSGKAKLVDKGIPDPDIGPPPETKGLPAPLFPALTLVLAWRHSDSVGGTGSDLTSGGVDRWRFLTGHSSPAMAKAVRDTQKISGRDSASTCSMYLIKACTSGEYLESSGTLNCPP